MFNDTIVSRRKVNLDGLTTFDAWQPEEQCNGFNYQNKDNYLLTFSRQVRVLSIVLSHFQGIVYFLRFCPNLLIPDSLWHVKLILPITSYTHQASFYFIFKFISSFVVDKGLMAFLHVFLNV